MFCFGWGAVITTSTFHRRSRKALLWLLIVGILDFLVELDDCQLILNGDTLDSLDLRTLPPLHWQILTELRRRDTVWLAGNHDGPAERLSALLGIAVHDEYRFESGGKNILVLHGDRFDSFCTAHPLLTAVGDGIYNATQRISTRLARHLKTRNKTFLHCAAQVREGASRYAKRHGYDVVVCGHSHHVESIGNYYNGGSWTEVPCTWLCVSDGLISVNQW
jgi:UDP-2,3-diacylglucosamine pyrophosphatase LpxH